MTPTEYLHTLYGQCCSALPGEIVVIDADGKSRINIVDVDDLNRVAEIVTDRECFIKVNLIDTHRMLQRSQYAIGNVDEVACIVGIALDIDAGKGKYLSRAAMLEAINKMRCKPTMIVNSNGPDGGLHVYWLLHRPHYLIEAADRDRCRKLSQSWLDELRRIAGGPIDGTANLDRYLRPVGSIRKSGNVVDIHEYHADRRYSLDDFIVDKQPAAPEPTIEIDGRLIEDLSPDERRRWDGLIERCATASHGSRSEADYSLLLLAHELGLDRHEVECYVSVIGKFEDREGTDYFDRTWDSASKDPRAKRKSVWKNDIQIITLDDLMTLHPKREPVLIEGALRVGETMLFVSGSKAYKSWTVGNLAFSIANGGSWLGRSCSRGRVLVIDCELMPSELASRYKRIAQRLGVSYDSIDIISLRGRLMSIDEIARIEIQRGVYAAIIIDALYRTLPKGTSENDNADMQRVFNEIDSFALRTGAACIVIHHASKGDQSGKNVLDVGAGAGAMARAVDCYLTIREHEIENCAVAEFRFRSFPEAQPKTLQWEFPTWIESDKPPILKTPKNLQERKRQYKDDAHIESILSLLRAAPKPVRRQVLKSKLSFGESSTFRRILNLLVNSGRIKKRTKNQGKEVYYQIA